MISIQTKHYTSSDIADLFEALKNVQEGLHQGVNSNQLKTDLDSALRYLNEQYAEKSKAERNRS